MYDEETLNEILDNDRREFEDECARIQAEAEAEAEEGAELARMKVEAEAEEEAKYANIQAEKQAEAEAEEAANNYLKRQEELEATYKEALAAVTPTNHPDIEALHTEDLFEMIARLDSDLFRRTDPYPKTTVQIKEKLLEQIAFNKSMEE